MARKGILVLAALMLVANGRVNANDELAITELYGQAVHAYFDGEYEESHKFLSDAIELGTDDPRVFYFRGLSKMKLGRADEAKSDFAEGGKLEASGPAQFYPVGRSLERVQGAERTAIEKVRKQARIAIRLRLKKIEQARIEAFKRDEKLRNAGPKVQLGNPTDTSTSEEDPFGSAGNAAPNTGAAPAATPKTGTPATGAAPAKTDDPFAAPKKTTEPANSDPFAAPKKATEPANDDPFAAPKKSTEPANDDPFADPKKPAAPAKGGQPPKNNDDPFADPGKSGSGSGGKADDDPFK